MPAALKPAVVGITALNDFRAHTNLLKRTNFNIGSGTHALVPEDLATIYNLNPLFNAGLTGQGQTIVVVEDSNVTNKKDWATFRSTFGLAGYTGGSFTQVHPAGSTRCRNPLINEAESEAILDAEWSSAAAPNAAIVAGELLRHDVVEFRRLHRVAEHAGERDATPPSSASATAPAKWNWARP